MRSDRDGHSASIENSSQEGKGVIGDQGRHLRIARRHHPRFPVSWRGLVTASRPAFSHRSQTQLQDRSLV